MQQHRKNSWQVLWQQQPEKKTTSKVGGKNKNGSLFVLEERANYKTSWLCGFNKASQRAWSRVRFGVQRMWVVSFSVHKQAVSVHPGTPQYTQRGRIVAATSTNKLLCDSLAPLTLLKQTRALCPFFRAPLSPLCICDINGAPDYFQTIKEGFVCSMGFVPCISLLILSPHLHLIIILFKKVTKTEFTVQSWLQKTKPAQIKAATAIKAH